jgi:hypothetical protein
MNCLECQDLVQRSLDGDPLEPGAAELEHHLAACSDCRELYAAAQRLVDGLRLLVVPQPPAGLADRICARVQRDQRRRRRLQRVTVLAVAAGILFAVCAVWLRSGSRPAVDEPTLTTPLASSRVPVASVQFDSPPLERRVEEAGEAVVALTRRTANETMGQGRILLPAVVPETPAPNPAAGELPTQPLQEAQQGVTEGLEPVATSARRAVALFLGESPAEPTNRTKGPIR